MKKATLEYQIKKDMSNLSEFTNRLDSAAESIKKYDYEISSRFVAFEGSPFFLVYIKSKMAIMRH